MDSSMVTDMMLFSRTRPAKVKEINTPIGARSFEGVRDQPRSSCKK